MLVDDGTYPQAKSDGNFLLLDGGEAFGVDGVEVTSVGTRLFPIELVFLESWQLKISIFVGPFFFDKTSKVWNMLIRFFGQKNKPIGVFIT